MHLRFKHGLWWHMVRSLPRRVSYGPFLISNQGPKTDWAVNFEHDLYMYFSVSAFWVSSKHKYPAKHRLPGYISCFVSFFSNRGWELAEVLEANFYGLAKFYCTSWTLREFISNPKKYVFFSTSFFTGKPTIFHVDLKNCVKNSPEKNTQSQISKFVIIG